MIEEDLENKCASFARLFEKQDSGYSLKESEEDFCKEHLAQCRACEIWQSEHRQISELAALMPQFDVSEGLTQKILDSVAKEATPKIETSLLPLALSASAVFLVMLPFDSWQSVLGWGAGFLGMLLLQALMNTANSSEQVV